MTDTDSNSFDEWAKSQRDFLARYWAKRGRYLPENVSEAQWKAAMEKGEKWISDYAVGADLERARQKRLREHVNPIGVKFGIDGIDRSMA